MRRTITVVFASCMWLVATGWSSPAPAAAPKPLGRGDLRWLNRVTFGIDSDTVARYQRLGRVKFLDDQLHPGADPSDLAAPVAALTISQQTAEQRMQDVRIEQQRINALTSDDEKQKARAALNQRAAQTLNETARRSLMRAVRSPAQLREQMTWFWMNHFNVFSGKANARWTLADYEQTLRGLALGRFRDLVLATTTSPAMLEYLDNAQSAVNRINENYARELLELHTLGVSGGPSGSRYSQQDVQELARVLTGVGVNLAGTTPKVPLNRQTLLVRRGLFEFNPARHDFGTKVVLAHIVEGSGFAEVEDVVGWLCRQPATAKFVSRKIATYFVSDDPPARLVDAMAQTFLRTDGDIADVLRVMFTDREVVAGFEATGAPAARVQKFKDPMRFVVSSLRLAYDGQRFPNFQPVVNWLAQLGEPLYGRLTPDGYPLAEQAWTSSGQMVRRFEIARAIGSGSAGLFNTDDNKPGPSVGFPMLTNRLFYDVVEPSLSAGTRTALKQTASQQEWNTVLLSSPDWMQP
ncbi:MAG: DUF1800 domain-containing protein [Acidobacteriota bacterium]